GVVVRGGSRRGRTEVQGARQRSAHQGGQGEGHSSQRRRAREDRGGRRQRRGVNALAMAQANAAAAVQNIFKTPELKEKILFTLLCLLVYRVGAHVTAPGVDPKALVDYFHNQANGLLGLYNLFTGGQFSRSTVFALGIMPYI